MVLIDKIKAIGDAIRNRTGVTGLMSLDEMAEMIDHMESGPTTYDMNTYIIVDENGNEVPAVLTEEEVVLTATAANDIRIGTTAVTDEGVVTGEKEIPSYRATEGYTIIKPGKNMVIEMISDMCDYTTLQGIICAYNTNMYDSVSTEKVVLFDKVYNVGTTAVLSVVSVDSISQTIKLGLTNDSEDSIVIHFMIIKEDA